MQEGTYQNRIERAKELLKVVRHAALATVNSDGSPHNSPVFASFDNNLHMYWASGTAAQHSQNIARDERVFIVLFDSLQKGGGLYIKATASELEGKGLGAGIQVVNANRARWNRPPVESTDYSGGSPQRLYCAKLQQAWVNVTDYDANGDIVSEARRTVAVHDLL